MSFLGYDKLNIAERRFYTQILTQLKGYGFELSFDTFDDKALFKAYSTVILDHPELFWIQGGYTGSAVTVGGRKTISFSPTCYYKNVSVIRAMKLRMDAVVDSVVTAAKRKGSIYEQILYVHDYLVDQTEYDPYAPNRYSAYGCLVDRRAVCAGYAAAFQMIMQRLGIPACRVTGNKRTSRATEAEHEWNCVAINGQFFFVDVTWDDPTVNNASAVSNKTHDYFCLSRYELSKTHRISNERYVPECTSDRYDYYKYFGYYLERYSFSAFENIALKQLRNGDKICVKFSSQYELNLAKRDLIDGQRIFNIMKSKKRISFSVSESGQILSIS